MKFIKRYKARREKRKEMSVTMAKITSHRLKKGAALNHKEWSIQNDLEYEEWKTHERLRQELCK